MALGPCGFKSRPRHRSRASLLAALAHELLEEKAVLLEVIGAAIALGLLGLYLSVLGRGVWPMAFATALVTMLLLVTFDLDRPTRGLITIPDTPYTALKASMELPPAASP